MNITLTTPALLFSAISLLLLAYTNRFLAIAALVRNLRDKYRENPTNLLIGQIINLKRRVKLIRNMQLLGLGSLLLCVLSMFLMFIEQKMAGIYVFGLALIMLLVSLAISMWEIHISVNALNLHLGDIENEEAKKHGIFD
ncbi:MAG: DUF2721 domain-containing protein [Bacteroidota bacterium]